MKRFVIYQNRRVEVVDMIIRSLQHINLPVITQVKVEFKEDGEWFDEWVDADKVEFDT